MAATSATVVSLVGGQAAEAVTFNFQGGPKTEGSIFFSEQGIGVTATANGNGQVAQRANGLGVKGGRLDSPQLDGLGKDETLELTFDQQIILTSATFSRVGFNDEFKLFVDGDKLVAADIPGGNLFDKGSGTFDFTYFAKPDRTGSVLGFTVTDFNDDYFLSSIEVEEVPEPLTILGSLSALGMGVLLKKQQKKIN